jgi:hypothetical protein
LNSLSSSHLLFLRRYVQNRTRKSTNTPITFRTTSALDLKTMLPRARYAGHQACTVYQRETERSRTWVDLMPNSPVESTRNKSTPWTLNWESCYESIFDAAVIKPWPTDSSSTNTNRNFKKKFFFLFMKSQ